MSNCLPPDRLLSLLPRLNLNDIDAELGRREAEAKRQASIDADLKSCSSLSQFIQRAWPVIEPGTKYIHGWHIDAMATHLEAVAQGQIRRLIINVPPGASKSTVVGVFFPMWLWGPLARPHSRIVGVAHEQTLGVRDNLKCRRLVMSDWFQERWPVAITGDQNEKLNFENVSTGFRSVATPSNITGRRGDLVIIDDPISVENANSVVEREKVNLWFAESLPTRLNHPEQSAIVLVMQRVHEDDPTGMILAKGWGWEHLMIPMRYEPDRACHTSIGWSDPRKSTGELFFPTRFPESVVEEYEKTLGQFAFAGQMQQRPVPREGAMFKRHWFKTVKAAPAGTRWVRYWDLAATEDQFGADPAYTVGLKMGRMPDGRFIVGDVFRLRAEGTGVRRMIRETAIADGPYCEVGGPQDPGQAGKVQAQDMVAMLAGFVTKFIPETGDKITRAEPVAAQAEAGNIDVLEGDWNKTFFDEITTFPGSRFKDQVDALSGAFSRLLRSNMFGVAEELIAIEPIRVPSLYARCAAIHIEGGLVTVVWGAFNVMMDRLHIYEVYQAPRQALPIHADVIRRAGNWIPVLFDMEAAGRTKDEGTALAHAMADLGTDMLTVDADIEAGVAEMAARLATKRLVVFSTMPAWFGEYRRFTRDEKGEISTENTGIMQCTAMIARFGREIGVTENRAMSDARGYQPEDYEQTGATGY